MSAAAGERASDRIPFRTSPMLATLVDEPFHRPGWVYEEKYDGYRVLAYKEGRDVSLVSRTGKPCSARFPDISAAVRALPVRSILLDGEAVAFDRELVSRFQLLQKGEVPVVFAAFDCLWVDGRDLRAAPLSERRAALDAAIAGADEIFAARRLPPNGLTAYRAAKKKGFEGLVAKEEASAYEPGRSRRWLKVKIKQEEEFVIGGYTAPGGTRSHFGALLLGAYAGAELRFVGKVGTGFDERTLASLAKRFRPLARATPAFADPPRMRDVTWLEPRLVAQIAFTEWTADAKLRQSVYLGLRDDKKPTECLLPESLR
ncbi:MAG TPA: non-homologous end-joining DNA ligase [Candidatus Binatia bacterium]|nr:non-homologous end-joining DNA ligase [Candidatus Binatia bacterium]